MNACDPFGQDWKTVVLRGNGTGKKDASRDGPRESGGGGGRGRGAGATMSAVTGRPAWKVEADVDGDDGHGIRRTPRDDARAIGAARVAQKLTQAQLAQRLNLPVQAIRDIEAGTAPENRARMAQIRRALGIP